VSSPTFTYSRPQGTMGSLDHIKWLTYYRNTVQLTGDETVYEATISGCQLFNAEVPVPREMVPRIRNINEDYRLCCSALVLSDESSMIEAMFLITNGAIYALYQRLPSEQINLRTHTSGTELPIQNSSFASSALLMRRGCGSSEARDLLDDSYRLGISVSDGGTSLVWYIDRREVFRVPRVGYRMKDQHQVLERGGVPSSVRISSFRAGFGHFTFLDHQLPNNYERSHIHLDTITDPSCPIPRSESGLVMLGETGYYRETLPDLYGRYNTIVPSTSFAIVCDSEKYRLFGQGAVTCIRNLHIYHRYRSIPHMIPINEEYESTPSPPKGRVRRNESLTSPTTSPSKSRALLGRGMQLDPSGTPKVRRSYHRYHHTHENGNTNQRISQVQLPLHSHDEGEEFTFKASTKDTSEGRSIILGTLQNDAVQPQITPDV